MEMEEKDEGQRGGGDKEEAGRRHLSLGRVVRRKTGRAGRSPRHTGSRTFITNSKAGISNCQREITAAELVQLANFFLKLVPAKWSPYAFEVQSFCHFRWQVCPCHGGLHGDRGQHGATRLQAHPQVAPSTSSIAPPLHGWLDSARR